MEGYLYSMNGSVEAECLDRKPSGTTKHAGDDESLAPDLRRAILATRRFFFDHQHSDGFWTAELESDAPLQAETILLLAFLGEEDSEPAKRCAAGLLESQLADGGWGKNGKADIDDSVKAYFALKLAGQPANADTMQRARTRILELGGADRAGGDTRVFLAILGQISHRLCSVVPPQFLLLPWNFPIGIHSVSPWFRSVLVALSVVSALAPVRNVPMEKGIRELFVQKPEQWKPSALFCRNGSSRLGTALFRMAETMLRLGRRCHLTPLRKAGIEKARQWMLEHLGDAPASGILWIWIALKSLGCDDDSEEIRSCRRHLESLTIHDGDTDRIQPCRTPVPDTSLALKALMASGLTPDHPAIRKGAQWIRHADHRLGFYPDCDAAALALFVLAGRFDEVGTAPPKTSLPPDLRLLAAENAESPLEARQTALDLVDTTTAVEDGLRRLLAMQCRDGGWAAFDRNNDPSTPDITGRVLETLGRLGFRIGRNSEVERAAAFLKRQQRADGSWPGHWGVNGLYGTWLALTGMAAVGVPLDDPAMEAGANWLLAYQHADGGWGETPESRDDPSLRGVGESTVSQTSWAVMALMASGRSDDEAVRRGIRFLLDRRRNDGTWHESAFTGAAAGVGSSLKYHFYSVCYPLMALSMYAARTRAANMALYDGKAVLRMEKIRLFAPEKHESDRRNDSMKKENRPHRNPPTLRLFLG